ncbi:MAG: hypothetical protein P4L90_22260 [Rhodopila sp.]|nr:hypothetical protein [Rhodopila sp.]
MPIGVMLWLRYGNQRGGRAFVVAASVSFMVELARYFRPGLEGDINAVVVAGLSAMFATRLLPVAWSMLVALARQSAPGPLRRWQMLSSGMTGERMPRPLGDVEHF